MYLFIFEKGRKKTETENEGNMKVLHHSLGRASCQDAAELLHTLTYRIMAFSVYARIFVSAYAHPSA